MFLSNQFFIKTTCVVFVCNLKNRDGSARIYHAMRWLCPELEQKTKNIPRFVALNSNTNIYSFIYIYSNMFKQVSKCIGTVL